MVPFDAVKEKEPKKCDHGMVFKDCGTACTMTCEDRNPVCTDQCVLKCECPSESPILHNNECIPESQCPASKGKPLNILVP